MRKVRSEVNIRGLTESEALAVVERVSRDRYDGNIVARESGPVGWSACHMRLWATDSHGRGARTSVGTGRERYCHAASWGAYRDVIRAMLESGARSVHTGLGPPDYRGKFSAGHSVPGGITYRSVEDFDAKYRETGETNIGSMMYPVTMRDLTVHFQSDEEGEEG